jgi:ABC-type antimicrobial peptide transport system ATPase subunit
VSRTPLCLLLDGVVIVIVESHKDVLEAFPAAFTGGIRFLAMFGVAAAVESALLFNAAREPVFLPKDASTFASVNNVLVDSL